ncbi:MAG: SEL1-like repeat protein [Verrucomicrobia bacterium]|nr:SEL1-like repeat protein [Verrucomicrobiota bacterium]
MTDRKEARNESEANTGDHRKIIARGKISLRQSVTKRPLAELYERGHGVPQDYTKAREWYQKAADKGNTEAKEALSRLASIQQK